MDDKDIAIIQGAFTNAYQNAEGTWFVSLNIGNQSFNINDSAESLIHANWIRRQLAIALLKFRGNKPLKGCLCKL